MNKKRELLHRRRADGLQLWRLVQTLRTQGRGLVTGMLVACIFLLLVGIAMQLPPPAPPAPPDIFTEVPYSTLIKDIQAEQVVAANMQGNALNALLVPGRRDTLVAGHAREDAAFGDCPPEDIAGCFDEEGQLLFSRARVLFTVARTVNYPKQDTTIHTTAETQPWAATIGGKSNQANQNSNRTFPNESGEHGSSSTATATPSQRLYKSLA